MVGIYIAHDTSAWHRRTIIEETYRTHPQVSAACAHSITGHAKGVEADVRDAMQCKATRDRGVNVTIGTTWAATDLRFQRSVSLVDPQNVGSLRGVEKRGCKVFENSTNNSRPALRLPS